jgi:hypothetical protein
MLKYTTTAYNEQLKKVIFIQSFPFTNKTPLIIKRLTLFKSQKVSQKVKPINNYNTFVSAFKLNR